MNHQEVTPNEQCAHIRPSDDPVVSGPNAADRENALRAIVEERTAQLEKVNEDLLRTNAELLRAKEQSRQNADYLQAVLNHSPAAIGFIKAVFDKPDPLHGDPAFDPIIDYRLVALNQKFALLVGESIGQLIGQSAARLTRILWHDDTYATLHRIVTEDAVFYEEREYDNEAGQPRSLSFSAVKHDGGVVLTGLDITELRQTQLQREALRQQANQSAGLTAQLATLRQQVKDRGESARTTSHDLRSSLGVVQGAAQLLDFAESDDDRVQIMEMINRNVQQMAQLLTELVNNLPTETDKQPLQ